MVKIESLKGKMKEKGVSVQEAAEAVGVDQSTFYRKLERQGENFTIIQAQRLVNFLGLSAEDACEIFLNQKLTQTRAGKETGMDENKKRLEDEAPAAGRKT